MAAGDDKNRVRRILESKLDQLSSVSSSSQASIFRAPRQLRQVNFGAFKPQIISIGPYFKDNLKAMEIHKVRYLSNLLQRRNDLESYIAVSLSMEGEARHCYERSVNYMSSEYFVAMMVLDGLFVVELINKFMGGSFIEENDALFMQNLNLTIVAQDLLLLENQLPFFVLEKFALMTVTEPNEEPFVKKALLFFSVMVPGLGVVYDDDHLVIQDKKHLLGLLYHSWLPSPEKLERNGLLLDAGKWDFIRSATELLEVGIRFEKGEGSLFDIKFAKGKMHIPTLIVDRSTERIFRNLIAYEQLNQGFFSIVMDYARLMDCLINCADDVALLSDCGIIDNRLGSNEEVAIMFNKLNDYVYLSSYNFYYSKIFYDVNAHCGRSWNLWKVKLRQKSLHTPWDWVLTSIVAATIFWVLTPTLA